jgi:carboxypeptidase D
VWRAELALFSTPAATAAAAARVLLAQLAEHICSGYKQQDKLAQRVVRDMHLFLMPSMNPDGFELKKRNNA